MKGNFKKNIKSRKGGKSTWRDRSKSREEVCDDTSKDVVESKKTTYNDASWYGSGQPVVDAATLAYSNPLGDALQISSYLSNGATKLTQNYTLPGIMAIGVQPLLYANNGQDKLATIQTVAQKIYSFVRHANSGSKNYERTDLMMYLGATSEIYSLIAWATLAYGLCFTYNQKNKYYGKALVDALGFDYDDITSNLADFRAYINSIIQVVNTLYVPKGLTYIDRKVNLYSHIIKDADDPKGCVYLFRPESFLQWDGKSYSTGTALRWINSWDGHLVEYTDATAIFNMKLNFEEFKTLATSLVSAIIDDEDTGVIAGDILKAYQGNVRTISLLPTEFQIEPTYNIEALEIINNLTMVGTPTAATEPAAGTQLNPSTASTVYEKRDVHCFGVYQLDGQLISDPYFGEINLANTSDYFQNAGSAYYGPIFSLHQAGDPGMNMVVSRLKANTYLEKEANSGGYTYEYYKLNEAGSEVCTRLRLYVNDSSVQDTALNTNGVVSGTSAASHKLVANIEAFDWHPIIYNKVSTTTSADIQAIHYEFDNYTVEHPRTLRKMNRTALLAMFGVLSTQ